MHFNISDISLLFWLMFYSISISSIIIRVLLVLFYNSIIIIIIIVAT